MRAAAVIIGNEVLSGKVADTNGAYLLKRFAQRGIPLSRLAMVPDEVDPIVDEVVRCLAMADLVVTSGGIGPTHDDVTVRSVALALGRRVVRLPELEALVRRHYGDAPPRAALRLAEAPEGTRLTQGPGTWYPVLACGRVRMLPGVPQLFRTHLEVVVAEAPCQPRHVRTLFLATGEAEIAGALDRVALGMPSVAIGSYPEFDPSLGYRVRVTVEHASDAPVSEAVDRLVRELPAGAVLRVEVGPTR